MKKEMKKNVEVVKINDGFIYININDNRLNQIYCVFYPEQDNWHMYANDVTFWLSEKRNIDVKTINNSEMKILIKIIDEFNINVDEFINILLETGYKNTYRCSLYFEFKNDAMAGVGRTTCIGDKIKGAIEEDKIKETITMYDIYNSYVKS